MKTKLACLIAIVALAPVQAQAVTATDELLIDEDSTIVTTTNPATLYITSGALPSGWFKNGYTDVGVQVTYSQESCGLPAATVTIATYDPGAGISYANSKAYWTYVEDVTSRQNTWYNQLTCGGGAPEVIGCQAARTVTIVMAPNNGPPNYGCRSAEGECRVDTHEPILLARQLDDVPAANCGGELNCGIGECVSAAAQERCPQGDTGCKEAVQYCKSLRPPECSDDVE